MSDTMDYEFAFNDIQYKQIDYMLDMINEDYEIQEEMDYEIFDDIAKKIDVINVD
jgi:hypothetical protein